MLVDVGSNWLVSKLPKNVIVVFGSCQMLLKWAERVNLKQGLKHRIRNAGDYALATSRLIIFRICWDPDLVVPNHLKALFHHVSSVTLAKSKK